MTTSSFHLVFFVMLLFTLLVRYSLKLWMVWCFCQMHDTTQRRHDLRCGAEIWRDYIKFYTYMIKFIVYWEHTRWNACTRQHPASVAPFPVNQGFARVCVQENREEITWTCFFFLLLTTLFRPLVPLRAAVRWLAWNAAYITKVSTFAITHYWQCLCMVSHVYTQVSISLCSL